ncbi:MAG: site-2 protease family protein [Thermoguttaceae bacterium]
MNASDWPLPPDSAPRGTAEQPQEVVILVEGSPPPGRRPLQYRPLRLWLPAVLFVATCFSTWYVAGWVYAACLMTILLCHEAGHYLQARRHGVRASLPFFIPLPFSPIGTMGAIILMEPRAGDRRGLFDIGITGPLAGLVPTLVFSVIGLYHSKPDLIDPRATEFGEPLIFRFLSRWIFGPMPEGFDVYLSPMAMAGWVGLLVTAINLFPIGQLDGGHILYGLLRWWARPVASMLLAGAVVAAVYFRMAQWWFMLLLLVLMGPGHPPTSNDYVRLGPVRTILGWLTLAFLPLGFTPDPFPSLGRPPRPRPVQLEDRNFVWNRVPRDSGIYLDGPANRRGAIGRMACPALACGGGFQVRVPSLPGGQPGLIGQIAPAGTGRLRPGFAQPTIAPTGPIGRRSFQCG